MAKPLKETLYLLLEDPEGRDPRARAIRAFLLALILLNIAALILETVREFSIANEFWFNAFEWLSVGVFTVEYAARVWVGGPGRASGLAAKVRHALSPLMLVDLLAILPFYLPLLLPANLVFLRALRLMRLMRVLKLGRYSEAIQIFCKVVMRKKEQLVVACIAVLILLIISSSLMYYFENDAQPDAFSSIPQSMWWAIVTMTTVGYGDVYPITGMGRLLASVIALLGIAMFAVPAGILSAGFVEHDESAQTASAVCPHCGKPLGPGHTG
ncbi:ion transporter [Pseudodesulfovibrio pelocollis]|uniref:ion transporter n=1 Tax=Pseudodesulfovibrio pelocollis TaxID=3051432 RepID=UPI00255A8D7F|nr:ion transporter [Pseudodesulfovibrio sp. SB368]